jgi:hypothetical protein
MNLSCNNLIISSLTVSKCLMCVFVHSRFVENPLVDLEATKPSFLGGSVTVGARGRSRQDTHVKH